MEKKNYVIDFQLLVNKPATWHPILYIYLVIKEMMNLNVENIKFGYIKERLVLNNISLSVNTPRTIAIVGASGCGKSTFLRVLCGLIQKTKSNLFEGRILVDGFKPQDYTKQGKVGFMFQDETLFPNLNVWENVAFPLKLTRNADLTVVDRIVQTVGLEEFKNYLPTELSGGMKSRVALARSFVTKPQLLLLDEPFSKLDIRWKFLLYQELETLREKFNPLVVLVTHDIQEALLLSNHILVFGKGGKILSEMHLDKPLPRVFDLKFSNILQSEFLAIQKTIMEDGEI